MPTRSADRSAQALATAVKAKLEKGGAAVRRLRRGESGGGETAVRSGTREGAEEEGVRCAVGDGEEVGVGGGAGRDCEGG